MLLWLSLRQRIAISVVIVMSLIMVTAQVLDMARVSSYAAEEEGAENDSSGDPADNEDTEEGSQGGDGGGSGEEGSGDGGSGGGDDGGGEEGSSEPEPEEQDSGDSGSSGEDSSGDSGDGGDSGENDSGERNEAGEGTDSPESGGNSEGAGEGGSGQENDSAGPAADNGSTATDAGGAAGDSGTGEAGAVTPDPGTGAAGSDTGGAATGSGAEAGDSEAGTGTEALAGDTGINQTDPGTGAAGSVAAGTGTADSGSVAAGTGTADGGSVAAGSGTADSGSVAAGTGTADGGSVAAGTGTADSGSVAAGSGTADSGSVAAGTGTAGTGSVAAGTGTAGTGSVAAGTGTAGTGTVAAGSGTADPGAGAAAPGSGSAASGSGTAAGGDATESGNSAPGNSAPENGSGSTAEPGASGGNSGYYYEPLTGQWYVIDPATGALMVDPATGQYVTADPSKMEGPGTVSGNGAGESQGTVSGNEAGESADEDMLPVAGAEAALNAPALEAQPGQGLDALGTAAAGISIHVEDKFGQALSGARFIIQKEDGTAATGAAEVKTDKEGLNSEIADGITFDADQTYKLVQLDTAYKYTDTSKNVEIEYKPMEDFKFKVDSEGKLTGYTKTDMVKVEDNTSFKITLIEKVPTYKVTVKAVLSENKSPITAPSFGFANDYDNLYYKDADEKYVYYLPAGDTVITEEGTDKIDEKYWAGASVGESTKITIEKPEDETDTTSKIIFDEQGAKGDDGEVWFRHLTKSRIQILDSDKKELENIKYNIRDNAKGRNISSEGFTSKTDQYLELDPDSSYTLRVTEAAGYSVPEEVDFSTDEYGRVYAADHIAKLILGTINFKNIKITIKDTSDSKTINKHSTSSAVLKFVPSSGGDTKEAKIISGSGSVALLENIRYDISCENSAFPGYALVAGQNYTYASSSTSMDVNFDPLKTDVSFILIKSGDGSKTKSTLSDGEMKVTGTTMTGTKIEETWTTEKGEATQLSLPNGLSYSYSEVKAPSGYVKKSGAVKFSVASDGTVYVGTSQKANKTVTIKNSASSSSSSSSRTSSSSASSASTARNASGTSTSSSVRLSTSRNAVPPSSGTLDDATGGASGGASAGASSGASGRSSGGASGAAGSRAGGSGTASTRRTGPATGDETHIAYWMLIMLWAWGGAAVFMMVIYPELLRAQGRYDSGRRVPVKQGGADGWDV